MIVSGQPREQGTVGSDCQREVRFVIIAVRHQHLDLVLVPTVTVDSNVAPIPLQSGRLDNVEHPEQLRQDRSHGSWEIARRSRGEPA